MFLKNALLLAATLSLAACGGGDDANGSFLVKATKSVNGLARTYTVCVETGDYIDPKSTAGKAMESALIKYYALITTPRLEVKSDSSKSCKDMDPSIDEIIPLADYNAIIVPATK